MPAQIIQMVAFTQFMDIWTPGITLLDHLKQKNYLKLIANTSDASSELFLISLSHSKCVVVSRGYDICFGKGLVMGYEDF